MEITGRVAFVQPMQSGTKADGSTWRKQQYVLLTTDQNPKYFAFDIVDGKEGKIARYNIQQGKSYTVDFDIRAGEWHGKWYNNVVVWNVREAQPQADSASGAAQNGVGDNASGNAQAQPQANGNAQQQAGTQQ